MNYLVKLQEICDKLKTITFFDGSVTALQLISFVVAFFVIFAILKFIKKSIKFVLFVIALIFLAISLGLFSPKDLIPTEEVLMDDSAIATISTLSNLSDNIKFDGTSVSIKTEDGTWIGTDDIKSFVKLSDGSIVLSVAGEDVTISDENVSKLLDLYSNK